MTMGEEQVIYTLRSIPTKGFPARGKIGVLWPRGHVFRLRVVDDPTRPAGADPLKWTGTDPIEVSPLELAELRADVEHFAIEAEGAAPAHALNEARAELAKAREQIAAAEARNAAMTERLGLVEREHNAAAERAALELRQVRERLAEAEAALAAAAQPKPKGAGR